MALPGSEVLIAGQYLVTYDATSLGLMVGDADVPTLFQTNHGEVVNRTDAYKDTALTAVYGGADYQMAMVCYEANRSAVKSALWPFNATPGVMGVIARLYDQMAKPLVLTAVTGTPAQVAGAPLTFTANQALLAPNFQSSWRYGPSVRMIPLRFQLWPFLISTGIIGWYTQT